MATKEGALGALGQPMNVYGCAVAAMHQKTRRAKGDVQVFDSSRRACNAKSR